MNHFHTLFKLSIIFLVLLILSGCGGGFRNEAELKKVKVVGWVGAEVGLRLIKVKGWNVGWDLTDYGDVAGALSEQEKNFFEKRVRVIHDVMGQRLGVKVVTGNIAQIQGLRLQNDPHVYAPQGFFRVRFDNKNAIRDACQKLGVDALAGVNVELILVDSPEFFEDRGYIQIRCMLKVVSKDGVSILEEEVVGDSSHYAHIPNPIDFFSSKDSDQTEYPFACFSLNKQNSLAPLFLEAAESLEKKMF